MKQSVLLFFCILVLHSAIARPKHHDPHHPDHREHRSHHHRPEHRPDHHRPEHHPDHRPEHRHEHPQHHFPGSWRPLSFFPQFTDMAGKPSGPGAAHLLTDGSVFLFNQGLSGGKNEAWLLLPDEYGSYVHGMWRQVAPFPAVYAEPFVPFLYSSAVLADGRLLIAGGEYNGVNLTLAHSNVVALYDPSTDTWTLADPPSFCDADPRIVGYKQQFPGFRMPALPVLADSPSVVLEDGTFMLGCSWNSETALLDPEGLTWKKGGRKAGLNHNEGFVLLPEGDVLTVDLHLENVSPLGQVCGSELYSPDERAWRKGSDLEEPISNPLYVSITQSYMHPARKTGPLCLRPDGSVVAFGGANTGVNAIYNSGSKTWRKGPQFPYVVGMGQLSTPDANAALLPNGNVLVFAGIYSDSARYNIDTTYPRFFFELTPDDELIPQPGYDDSLPFLLTLPTGQVLATDNKNAMIYTPGDRSYKREWAPEINGVPGEVEAGRTYKISGRRFNGMSQGCVMGDDYQNASNFPLVRIRNILTQRVFYCRTHHHSFMGVASDREVHTYFDIPANIEGGHSIIQVVANGIPSESVPIYVFEKIY